MRNKVLNSIPCPFCNGTGKIDHPAWVAIDHYNELLFSTRQRHLTNHEIRSLLLDNMGMNSQPRKIIDCFECNGSGIVKLTSSEILSNSAA